VQLKYRLKNKSCFKIISKIKRKEYFEKYFKYGLNIKLSHNKLK